jgi:hypothetical protein
MLRKTLIVAPYVLIALAVLGGGGAALYFTLHARERGVVVREDAGVIAHGDASFVAEVDDAAVAEPDAAVVIGPNVDGGVVATRDAGVLIAPHDHPKTVTVEVLTRPGEANVFVGHTFRGPSGVRLTEPYGTRLKLECHAPHYKGSITVVFDGTHESVMCNAKRLKFCVPGLKNPLEDCETPTGQDPQTGPTTMPTP